MEHAEHAEPEPHGSHVEAGEPTQPWTSVDEFSARLGVSRWTIVRAFHRGHVPGIKVGATYKLLAAFADEIVTLVHAGHGIDFEQFSADWIKRARELAS